MNTPTHCGMTTTCVSRRILNETRYIFTEVRKRFEKGYAEKLGTHVLCVTHLYPLVLIFSKLIPTSYSCCLSFQL